ncbi:uncharacterized protein BO95DRAFT_438290 [Aspergillus brunneoviolaceus CBS 621.78]|uniref:Uncharacterized protein n=1 Tax=Aspergillus brunneoviolaceus CBS 621.78 TaxID=1450534 RepID=A0ACD1GMV2_9EURO|nr:hypothetical protein BO95DRAFT_438290 [Aspergillus brunneoviolaceus CBS 621.78]RAH50463.1 hypothetical protein BO95DRAFT_438290 [Aspergillus brunneoviolaceus CBS 621.78]
MAPVLRRKAQRAARSKMSRRNPALVSSTKSPDTSSQTLSKPQKRTSQRSGASAPIEILPSCTGPAIPSLGMQ